jgi:hypothetical protein
VFQVDEILLLYGGTHLLSVVESDFFTVEIKTVSEAFCVVQDRIDRRSKPLFDVSADQVTGKEEEQQSGNEGKRDEEQKKLCFEMGSGNLTFSLEIEFYQAAGKNEQQDEEEQENDDLKGEEENVSDRSGGELLGLTEEKLSDEEKDDQSDHDSPQYPGTFSLCVFHFLSFLRSSKAFFLRGNLALLRCGLISIF